MGAGGGGVLLRTKFESVFVIKYCPLYIYIHSPKCGVLTSLLIYLFIYLFIYLLLQQMSGRHPNQLSCKSDDRLSHILRLIIRRCQFRRRSSNSFSRQSVYEFCRWYPNAVDFAVDDETRWVVNQSVNFAADNPTLWISPQMMKLVKPSISL